MIWVEHEVFLFHSNLIQVALSMKILTNPRLSSLKATITIRGVCWTATNDLWCHNFFLANGGNLWLPCLPPVASSSRVLHFCFLYVAYGRLSTFYLPWLNPITIRRSYHSIALWATFYFFWQINLVSCQHGKTPDFYLIYMYYVNKLVYMKWIWMIVLCLILGFSFLKLTQLWPKSMNKFEEHQKQDSACTKHYQSINLQKVRII